MLSLLVTSMNNKKKSQLRGESVGRERGVYKIRSFGRASYKTYIYVMDKIVIFIQ